MRTDVALALALALLVLPLPISQIATQDPPAPSANEAIAGPDHDALPWFLTDVVIPDDLPPWAVLPSWVYDSPEGNIWPSSIPDYAAMTVTDEQLNGTPKGRATYPQKYNFTLSVSFEWDATVTEFQDMDGGLKRFSNLVYDYTDGQFTIGRFELYNNKANWNSVNIHVLNKSWYRANANPGGLYYGGIIQVGRDAWGERWNTPMGAVTLAHEFGHYGLMLPDEYIEATQEPRCNNNTAGTCIMSDPYSYFEICTDESHNASSTGNQNSCWNYIIYYYPDVVEVHGAPDPGPTTNPASTVIWHYPDLSVYSTEMSLNPEKANEGSNVTVSIPVHNIERLVTATVTVRFFLDMTTLDKLQKTIYLNVNGQDAPTASFSWQAVGGTHTIIAVVDPDYQIKEMNDSNNQASKQVMVNSRPRISSSLTGFTSREDIPLTVKMTQYATDPEEPASALRWTVVKLDTRCIASVSGQNSPNQTITFNPAIHWSGATCVILGVADSGNLMSQKEIDLTITFFNYAPIAMDPSVSPSSTLRGRTVEVSSGASDVEDHEAQLTPLFEWRPNGSEEWRPIAGAFDGARFKALLAPTADSGLGKADLRVSFQDTLQNRGPWSYLNSSLDVQNNRPRVAEIGFSEPSVVRGGLVTVFINASDMETAADDLQPAMQYSVAEGEWRTVDIPGECFDGVWSFQLDVNGSWAVGAYDLRAVVRDPDGGTSDWLEVSDGLVVSNSFPEMNSARATRTKMLRNESCVITVTGEDYETPVRDLTIELKVRDPRGKEQPGYLLKAPWVNGSWEARFLPLGGAVLGKYILSARVGDADGGWSAWKDLPAPVDVGNNIPGAAFTGPSSAVQGALVRFDGSGSADTEDHLNMLSFSWNFGDGSGPGMGPLAMHSFPNPGTYSVMLTLTDKDGATATAQKTVSITQKPAAPIMGGGGDIMLITAMVVIVAVAAAGAYIMMKMNKGKNVSMIQDGRTVFPAPASRTTASAGAGQGAYHSSMDQCRQEHGQQRRWASNAEAAETSGTANPYMAALQPGPFPEPHPMPVPEPDPLRPAEPEPGPGPYPEPDDDDED